MRSCPVCGTRDRLERERVFSMDYKIPDGWPVPERITWYTCKKCRMLYGDGDFDQSMLDEYYAKFYGYGLGSAENTKRLNDFTLWAIDNYAKDSVIVDFGGGGEDGNTSVVISKLKSVGFVNAVSVGVYDELPPKCDMIYASHVLEHIYNLSETMNLLIGHLKPAGRLIVDGPDAAGANKAWPILDFSSKHINHFTLKNYLELGGRYGLELERLDTYVMGMWHCYKLHFEFGNVAMESRDHIIEKTGVLVEKLERIKIPVNLWGLSDVSWHLLSRVNLDILEYIDNDWAYRGQTYGGKPVLERPTNGAPILIMSQGQRELLIHNIRAMGIENELILL